MVHGVSRRTDGSRAAWSGSGSRDRLWVPGLWMLEGAVSCTESPRCTERLRGVRTPQSTGRPRRARVFAVHGAAPVCRDRLWGAGTPPSTRSFPVHGQAPGCTDPPAHRVALGAGTPQSTKRPQGVQSPPVHGRTLGRMERFWGAGTPPKHRAATDSPRARMALGSWSRSGCRDRLWDAGTLQNTGVHGALQCTARAV